MSIIIFLLLAKANLKIIPLVIDIVLMYHESGMKCVTSVTENGSCNVSHVSIREPFNKVSVHSICSYNEIEGGVTHEHWMAK